MIILLINLSVERTHEYTLSLCTTQQQASSNLQASKQSRSESKNTQRECVFFAKIAITREQLNSFKIAEHKQFHERSE